ncbi:hypothetical protein GGR56DRAFT_678414 [Xylariaceae sp. FL0804]|nr:hypothetical protein GGR56DRAFT_678414 [Xylariaceae sp. FL0804]
MRFIHIATLLCASTTGFVQGRAIPDVTHPCDYEQVQREQDDYHPGNNHPCDYDQVQRKQDDYHPGDNHPCDYDQCSNKKGCKRDEVYMDDLKDGDWTAEQFLYTTGLSGCTVMAVYDKNNYVMAHIPPGRMDDDGQLTATSLEVIEEFKGRMTTAYQGRSWQNPRAYLLTYATMGQQQRQSLQSWFTSLRNPNINSRQEEVYVRQGGLGDGTNPDAIVVPYGTGNLLIDRRGETWPPRITLS